MKNFFLILIISLSVMSCTYVDRNIEVFQIIPQTPEEKEYLQKVWETSLDFSIQNEDENIIWGRIQSFIGKYSSVKIQVATDYVVQTYNVEYEQFGYYVTRTPDVKETTFSIRCITVPTPAAPFSGYDYSKQAELNAHILAYFALTNEVNPNFIKQ